MAKFLVFVDHHKGQLKKGTVELLSAVASAKHPCDIVVFGEQAEQIANEAGKFVSGTAYICKDAAIKNYNSEVYTDLVSEGLKKSGATNVLASASMMAKDFFPRVAARLDGSIVSDCTELKINGDDISVRKPLYAGKCTAGVKFENAALKIILMRPNQLPLGAPSASSAMKIENLVYNKTDLKTLIKEVVKGASEKLDLAEANIIISGGRGMKEAKNFELLNPLAEVLGATVGASRAVVDAGWVPHSMQVGQTGKTVAPTLYIACGISGAIQHLAGMSGSKVIVAINNDPQAPIFQKATYGIVGDLFEIIPKLTEEFKRVLS